MKKTFILILGLLVTAGPCLAESADALSDLYVVQKGDNLSKIAKTRGLAPGFIQKFNQLQSDRIRVGQELRLPKSKLSILVDKSDNRLYLKAGEETLKTYIVSTGKNNSTPVGNFRVTDKLENPTWYKAEGVVIPPGSKENQLGTRWMGIDLKSYGIHGTIEPETLGQQVTAGCVRMKNEDVEELFGWIAPGTAVTIMD